MEYSEFLDTKQHVLQPCGIEPKEINCKLFDWQQDVTRFRAQVVVLPAGGEEHARGRVKT